MSSYKFLFFTTYIQYVHRRPFVFNQPEPGKKASKRYSNLFREFERHKHAAAGITVAAGATSASALQLLRKNDLNDAIRHRGQKVKELERVKAETAVCSGQSSYTSRSSVDSFIASARSELAADLREQISASEALILQMESDIPGYSFARDSGLITAAFAAAMAVALVGVKALAEREERAAAIAKKAEEPPKPRGRRIAEQLEDIAHAQTQFPAPVAPPKEEEAPEGKFPRPPYFNELFSGLKRSLREEMRSPGSEEAAEAFLCVMGRNEVEDLMHWPETIELHIAKHRDRLKEFLEKKKIDPRHLFERLGPEITGLF